MALILLIGDNLSKLDLNVLGLTRLTTETRQSIGGSLNVSSLDEVPRGVREEQEATAKNQTPGELDGDGNTVVASISSVLGGIDDNGSQHDTNGDTELVTGNQGATNLAGAL